MNTMLKIQTFTFNMFEEHTYVLYDAESRQAMIIDPGMFRPAEHEELQNFISAEKLSVKYIAHTHLHLDHIFGTAQTHAAYPDAMVLAHSADFELARTLPQQAQRFRLPGKFEPLEDITPIESLTEPLQLGDSTPLEVRHVPGHSPGGIAIYVPDLATAFCGDSLFQGSIGRTDLPGGNHAQLIRAIETQIFTLPPETTICPGHGPSTTVQREQTYNPYL